MKIERRKYETEEQKIDVWLAARVQEEREKVTRRWIVDASLEEQKSK